MTSPDINAHGAIDQFQFVDQGDVHAAENVFEQLGGSAARQEETGTMVLMARPYSAFARFKQAGV